MNLREVLESKVAESTEFHNVIDLVSRSIARDVEPIFLEGLHRVNRIIIAKAFTKYGWLLAIYTALGRVEEDKLIVCYNSVEPRWTASILIHEATHIGLSME